MPKTSRTTKIVKTAQSLLTEKHEFYNSWAAVSEELGGFNRGLLSSVSRGKRKAPPSLLCALGLPVEVTIKANPCTHCGKVPLSKRCPCKRKASTGPKRVYRDYPVWAMRELSELVTAQPEARVIVLGVGFDYENVKVGYEK